MEGCLNSSKFYSTEAQKQWFQKYAYQQLIHFQFFLGASGMCGGIYMLISFLLFSDSAENFTVASCPAHNPAKDYLEQTFNGRLISRTGNIQWSTRYPDLPKIKFMIIWDFVCKLKGHFRKCILTFLVFLDD